jgi:hypothetical protein
MTTTTARTTNHGTTTNDAAYRPTLATSRITTPSGITLNPSSSGLSYDFRHPQTGELHFVFRAAPHQVGRANGFVLGLWYARAASVSGLYPRGNGYETAVEAAESMIGGGS